METYFEVISECGETLEQCKTMKEAKAAKRELERLNRQMDFEENITIEKVTYILDNGRK